MFIFIVFLGLLLFELYLILNPIISFLIITDFFHGAFLFEIDFTKSYVRKAEEGENVK